LRYTLASTAGCQAGSPFKSAVDDPSRIAKSKAVGALFGLTPKKYQSGEKDVTGGITRAGDEMVRTALYEAANVLLSRITRFSKLKRWGMDVAKRRGSKRAKVALARKIGVILHRMWTDGTTYRWGRSEADRSAGLIKEEYETQAGHYRRPLLPEVPSPGRWRW